MFVRTACMFSHERETFNHLQRILCFHETLREKHGTRLIINDASLCKKDIMHVIMTADSEDDEEEGCTVADAERDCSTECQTLKKAPHLGVCFSACLQGKRRKVFQ